MPQIVLKRLSPALFVGWSGTLTAWTVATAKPRRGLRQTKLIAAAFVVILSPEMASRA